MKNTKLSGLLLLIMALAAGCLETETALGPPEQAKVDPKLVGEWKTVGDDENGELLVRNFNGREYYVEDRKADGEVRARYAVHVTDVKGGSFLHARPLSDDGEPSATHAILRLQRVDDNTVRIRHLDKDFFADKPHDTPAKLRAIVEQNLDNAAMYDGEPIAMTRKAR